VAADPAVGQDIQEIESRGPFCSSTTGLSCRPSLDNSKKALPAYLSAIFLLRQDQGANKVLERVGFGAEDRGEDLLESPSRAWQIY